MTTNVRKGNAALSGLKARLREMPITVAHAVAQKVAPALTSKAQGAFGSGQTVYGDARPAGVNGNPLDLVDTGKAETSLRFSASGRIVRAVLSKPYVKYLIGKYRILPNGPLPVEWKRSIDHTVHTTKVDLK